MEHPVLISGILMFMNCIILTREVIRLYDKSEFHCILVVTSLGIQHLPFKKSSLNFAKELALMCETATEAVCPIRHL